MMRSFIPTIPISSYEIQPFYCKHPDEKKIYGELYLPKESGKPVPLVILGHGFTGSYYLLKGYAEYLAERGIAGCIFDFCGGSNYSRSDGAMTDMSVVTQENDLELLVKKLKERPDLDRNHFFIGGESQGGLVAALTAAKIPDKIAGLILLYPAMYIPERMRQIFPERSKIPERFTQLGIALGRREIDVYRQIRKYQGRVLILHGSRDGMVPLYYSQKAEEDYKDAKLVVLPGAGHGIYSGMPFRKACREIEEFVKNGQDCGAER